MQILLTLKPNRLSDAALLDIKNLTVCNQNAILAIGI